MNRFLPFLLGAASLLVLTKSEGHRLNSLNGKFNCVFPETAHLNNLLLDNSLDCTSIEDTTNPGNKNKSTTTQDYNSTRSNKAHCVIIINMGEGSDGNDSVPNKHFAQDFNTVRSNRQNSNYSQTIIINTGGIHPTNRNQDKLKTGNNDGAELNDDRKSHVMIVVNPGNSSSALIKVYAKNLHTTYSAEYRVLVLRDPPNGTYNPWEMDDDVEGTVLNPLFDGTNENGIREKHYQIADNVTLVIRETNSNKNTNQEKDNPLYGGENTTHENPLYNSNAINGNSESGSTKNPGKQPSRQAAQDYNSTRSNKCNCFSIHGGYSNGHSDHTGNGWNIEMGNRFSISNRVKLAVSAGYTSLSFKYKGSPHLSEEYVQNMKGSIQDHKWSLMTLSAGPVLQLGKGKFTTDLYGKAGISFIQSPDQFIGISGAEGRVTDETGVAKFSGNTSALSFQAGIHFNYAISDRIDIFLNPNFFTAAGKNITYKEKDASKALPDGKTFDYKTFMSLPYETKHEQIRTLGMSVGLSIHFCN